jgi:hypothetical protein
LTRATAGYVLKSAKQQDTANSNAVSSASLPSLNINISTSTSASTLIQPIVQPSTHPAYEENSHDDDDANKENDIIDTLMQLSKAQK